MALFKRRKQKTDVLPEEVREYYQTERRERTGMAWLLAVGTLLVTFIIAAGLFFGGRWAYRTVFNHNDKKTASSNSDNNLRVDQNGNVVGGNQQATNSDTNPSTGTSSTSTSTPSPGNTNSSSSNTSTNNNAAKTPTTTPNTGPVELINTGPGDE